MSHWSIYSIVGTSFRWKGQNFLLPLELAKSKMILAIEIVSTSQPHIFPAFEKIMNHILTERKTHIHAYGFLLAHPSCRPSRICTKKRTCHSLSDVSVRIRYDSCRPWLDDEELGTPMLWSHWSRIIYLHEYFGLYNVNSGVWGFNIYAVFFLKT